MTVAVDQDIIILKRDCIARMVPSGAQMILRQGMEVTITQALGDTYTVNVYGNLARVDAVDADALGFTVKNMLADLAPDGDLPEKIQALLKSCYDPEIPVNIVDLGLIYGSELQPLDNGKFHIQITMTLTAPGCGMGPVIAGEIKQKMLSLTEVESAEVELVFDPPWGREKMSEAAQLQLGMF